MHNYREAWQSARVEGSCLLASSPCPANKIVETHDSGGYLGQPHMAAQQQTMGVTAPSNCVFNWWWRAAATQQRRRDSGCGSLALCCALLGSAAIHSRKRSAAAVPTPLLRCRRTPPPIEDAAVAAPSRPSSLLAPPCAVVRGSRRRRASLRMSFAAIDEADAAGDVAAARERVTHLARRPAPPYVRPLMTRQLAALRAPWPASQPFRAAIRAPPPASSTCELVARPSRGCTPSP
ncbi:hypothetical protein Dimus_020756 [Dionaea muscipula]